MRRIVLDSPRMALAGPPPAVDTCGERAVAPGARQALGRVRIARERSRPLFDPRHGWLRRLERRAAHLLTDVVYPRIPGILRPYEAQLRDDLTLAEAEIPLAGLDPELDGLRLLLVTDIHAGPFVSPAALGRTFRRLLVAEPDLVLIGGDLTTSRVEDFLHFREAFRLLRAPLGTWAVIGNHEYYTEDAPRLRAEMAASGMRVLHNDWCAVKARGARLTLAGVDDLLLGNPDLDRALDGAPGPVILLSHNPDVLFEAARHGVALVLSGHTHAGQIRVPGLPVLVRQSRYRLDEGRYRFGTTELVVSRGLGAVGLPWRIACPPEAVLLRLRARTETSGVP